MTPTSEIALEIGWVCTTTLIAHTTAMIAKTKKRITSISGSQSNQKAGHQQVEHGDREKELPREAHQLVVAEARQRAANPDKREQDGAYFGAEPEERQQPRLHDGQHEHRSADEENHAECREGDLVHL